MQITSKDNKIVKYIKSLSLKKYRDEEATYFVEGTKIALESFQYYADIKFVIICPELLKKSLEYEKIMDIISKLNIECYEVNENIFNTLTDTVTSQGIIVVLKKPSNNIDINAKGLYIALDDVQDPGNVGTIIRIADAVNAKGIILTEKTADVFSPKVIRSSMGGIFRIPIKQVEILSDELENYKANGIEIIATSLKASELHYEHKYKEGTFVIIGNESKGISKEVMEKADALVKIPILGKAESLNASVAAGIIMYEIIRQDKKETI